MFPLLPPRGSPTQKTPTMTPTTIKLSRCLPAVLLVFLLQGCTSEVDDYFPQPASQRLAATIDRARQVLRSAPYGWEFEYYPGEDLAYGGMVYTVRFDSLTATVGCSLIPDSTETSLYRLTNDNGPVLTFDSYNSLLHYFSTPSTSEYEAKGGDFEFVIDSIADDFISLYGKKTHNAMYLRRLTATPDEYAENTINVFDHFVDSIHGTIGTATLAGKTNPVLRTINIVSGRDTFDVHYAYTDRGIRLYRPLRLGGVSVQSFDFDTDSGQLTVADGPATGTTLQGVAYPADFMSYARYEGEYTLAYDANSSVPVYLKPNRLEGTYLMQGLSPMYDLTLRYDPATGDLRLGAQVIGSSGGNTYYWATTNYANGRLSSIGIADEGQFTIRWNGNRFYPRFNFSATNPATDNVNSAIIIYLYTNDEGNLTAGICSDPDWLTNGSYLFANLKSLNRKGRMED